MLKEKTTPNNNYNLVLISEATPIPTQTPRVAVKMALLRLPRGSSTGLLLLGAAGVIGIGISKSMYTGEVMCTRVLY